MADIGTLELTSAIVTSFLENNKVAIGELPRLIEAVQRTLAEVSEDRPKRVEGEAPKATAAQIKRSITPEALVSFEDGKPYRLLKRHLNTFGLTPEQYRQKWGLPASYPMTAPAYTQKRSELAKASGLGVQTRRGGQGAK